MSAAGNCQWCAFGDICGAEEGRPVSYCPLASGREPTIADVLNLMTAIQVGINQRFAQIELLLNHHGHTPRGRP